MPTEYRRVNALDENKKYIVIKGNFAYWDRIYDELRRQILQDFLQMFIDVDAESNEKILLIFYKKIFFLDIQKLFVDSDVRPLFDIEDGDDFLPLEYVCLKVLPARTNIYICWSRNVSQLKKLYEDICLSDINNSKYMLYLDLERKFRLKDLSENEKSPYVYNKRMVYIDEIKRRYDERAPEFIKQKLAILPSLVIE